MRDLVRHEPVAEPGEDALLYLLGNGREVKPRLKARGPAQGQKQDPLVVTLTVTLLDRLRCFYEISLRRKAKFDLVPHEKKNTVQFVARACLAFCQRRRCLPDEWMLKICQCFVHFCLHGSGTTESCAARPAGR